VQEEEVQNRDQALEAAGREIQDLKRLHAATGDDATRMQSIIDDLRSKLEESKQQLKGNEQMIRWLNTQVRIQHVDCCQSSVRDNCIGHAGI
jgi:chromosome segregation ATPase